MLQVSKLLPQGQGLAPVLLKRATTVELGWDVRQKSRFAATDSAGRELGIFLPRGTLVRGGEVELGFQQLSELLHVPGITLAGPLPEPIQITTTFSGAVATAAAQPAAAQALLAFMASPQAAPAKRRQGMEPA